MKREFWSNGGYVSTVEEGVNTNVIRKYLKKQGKKSEQLILVEFV